VGPVAELARASRSRYERVTVLRPVAAIVAAILISRPEMPTPEARRYAQVLRAEAQKHDFDPFTGVSIIHHESGWRPELISASGEDYGLGQIRARYVGACREDGDPLSNPSPACRAVKRSLLRGEHNIREMAELITRHRALCRDKTGSAKFHRWLASYQGRNYPGEGRWCVPGEKTWQVIKYRSWLVSEVPRRLKARPGRRARD
jgi:hypothetical protein